MVDKVPADITPGNASRGSVVHASDNGLGNLSRSHSEEDISRLQSAINAYSVTLTYNIGDIVKESGLYWWCDTAVVTPEVFDANKWSLLSNEIGLFACAYNTNTAAQNSFWPLTGNNAVNATAENNVQVPIPDNTIFAELTLVVTANNRTDTTSFTFRINNANGNMTITVNAAQTGTFQDLSNTDSVTALDLVNYQVVENVTTVGALTMASSSVQFVRGET